MMMEIASLTHVVGGMEICHMWVLVWGLQRLFPRMTFITRSVRLHPVCITLAWHWILILMEKDYVIFTGTEIDYPFWPGWKVVRASFCRCWRGSVFPGQRYQNNRARTAPLTWTFFSLSICFCCSNVLPLRSCFFEQERWHGWQWYGL